MKHQWKKPNVKAAVVADAEKAGELIQHFLRGGNGGVETPMETTIMVIAFTKHLMPAEAWYALLDQLCLTEAYNATGQLQVVIDAGRLA